MLKKKKNKMEFWHFKWTMPLILSYKKTKRIILIEFFKYCYWNLFVKSHNFPGSKTTAYDFNFSFQDSCILIALRHFYQITFYSKRRRGRGDPNVYSSRTFYCVLNTKLRLSLYSSVFICTMNTWTSWSKRRTDVTGR